MTQEGYWDSFLTPRHKGYAKTKELDSSLPKDISEFLAFLYLFLKDNVPSFNVRHLKRASELLGF